MPDPARPPRVRRWLTAATAWWGPALVLLVAVVTIGLPLVGIGALHAADTMQLVDPWAQEADASFRPDNGTVSDTVDAVAPVRMAVAQRARDGDLALWSSTQSGGAPLLGVPNTAMLSPMNLPWWIAPPHWAPALAKFVQMLVGGGFLFLFLRRVGLSPAAASVGALGFVNAGHLVVWTTWPQSNVAALVPALFWAVDRAVSSPRFVDAWPVPLVGAVLWLEGFPALALWAHVLAGAYAVVRVWAIRPRRTPAVAASLTKAGPAEETEASLEAESSSGSDAVARVVAMVGAMATGVGIAAVQLVPFALRTGELDTSTRAAKAATALPWESLATLVVPDALGASGRGVWYGPRNEVEMQAFVGVVVVVLSIVALAGSRRLESDARAWVAFAASASLVIGALVWLGGPFHDAVQSLPLIGGNQTGRLRGLLAFVLAGTAAAGFEVLMRATRPTNVSRLSDAATSPPRLLGRIAAGVVVVFGALVPVLLRANELADGVGRNEFLSDAIDAASTVLGVSLLAVAAALLLRGPRRRAVALAVLPLLLAVESTAFARNFLPRIDTEDYYPRTVAHGVVEDLVGDDRFAAAGFALYPGTTTAYGLRSLTAHASMPTAWKHLLLAADPTAFDRNSTFPILGASVEVAASESLDLLGVSHFVTGMDEPVLGRRGAEVVSGALLPAGDAVHGVDVHRDVLAMLDDHDLPVDLAAWLVGEDGTRTAFGARRLTGREAGEWLPVPLAPLGSFGERDPAQRPDRGTLVVALVLDPTTLSRGYADVTSEDGSTSIGVPEDLRLRPVRVGPEGLRVVSAPDVVVYERPDALPRIRLESRSSALEDTAARAADGAAVTAPATLGTVEVVRDRDDELVVRVDAPTDGVLVVADAFSGGHLARVDGRRVDVFAAHGALVGIPVKAGQHEVRLTWHPEFIRTSAAITVLSLLAVFGLAFVANRRRVSSAS